MLARSLLFALLMSAGLARAAVPPEAFGRLPSIEQAALSPDGSQIALVRSSSRGRILTVVSLVDAKVQVAYGLGNLVTRGLLWADGTHLLLTTASTRMPANLIGEKTEWNLLHVLDVPTGKIRNLLDDNHSRARTLNIFYGRPVVQHTPEGTVLYLHGMYVERTTLPALFKINLTTTTETLLKQGALEDLGWLVNDQGEVVAEQEYLEREHRWRIRLGSSVVSRHTVEEVAPIDVPRLAGLTADGQSVVVLTTEVDNIHLRSLSLQDGSWGPDLSSLKLANRYYLLPGSQRVIGTALIDDEILYDFKDAALQEGMAWAQRLFPDERVVLDSVSADLAHALVRVFGPKSGYVLYVVDFKEHTRRAVGQIYEDVPVISPVQTIRYAAADGLPVQGYLTLPRDRPARNLPLIVLPHDGPQQRSTLDFHWMAQSFAAQGYAVLEPNYRGSGTGLKWIEAGFGQWGRKMQSDLSDGVRSLASQGIVDAQRVCIAGIGYGGYAALAGVALEPGVYRCAISVGGELDPAELLRVTARKEHLGPEVGKRYLDRFLGATGPGDKSLDAISPLKQAGHVTAPVLLIHGREDAVSPYVQSLDMAAVLKRAGKTVELVTLENEDHFLSRDETRLKTLTASIAFLRQYNPPD